jgi:outer membrane receptor protein involved in Fe transport
LEVYLGVRNLLDERRATMVDGTAQVYDLRPATGRTLFLGLNFEG